MGDVSLNNVRIRDENFLRQYDRGHIRLNQADVLKVKLLQRQKVMGSKLETSYELLEVLEYIRGAEQARLPASSN